MGDSRRAATQWTAVTWRAAVEELFPRFRSLTNDVPVLAAEIRVFLDASRVHDAGLTVLDFGGGSGELVATASRAQDQVVILDPVRDPSSTITSQRNAFDALIFSHVLPFVADPIALFAELSAYSKPAAASLAIVLDDTGTQADICRAAARTDARFLDYFGHAQRLEALLAAAEIPASSHTTVTRAIAKSHHDLLTLTVVAFYLNGVIDELVERLASTIAPDPNGDHVLTTHHRVFTWPSR